MTQVPKFITIQDESVDELVHQVNHALATGYDLHQGLVPGDRWLAQSMIERHALYEYKLIRGLHASELYSEIADLLGNGWEFYTFTVSYRGTCLQWVRREEAQSARIHAQARARISLDLSDGAAAL
jgi:hypothetical protein